MRSNKEIRKSVDEKYLPHRRRLMLYTLVFVLIPVIVGLIPIIGGTLSSIIIAISTIGFLATCVNIYNGHGEEETPVSYLSHSIRLFTNWFCASLWILLKAIVGVIIMIVGACMLFASIGTDAIVVLNGQTANVDVSSISGIGMIGLLLYFVGALVTIIISLKYSCIAYEIVHDNKSGKKAKELVESSRVHLEGHVWQWICMGIYYGLLLFALVFVISFVGGLLAGLAQSSVAVAAIIGIVVVIAIYAVMLNYMPKLYCAYEELYKELVGGDEAPSPAPEMPTDNPVM